jgi:hypothetical protein
MASDDEIKRLLMRLGESSEEEYDYRNYTSISSSSDDDEDQHSNDEEQDDDIPMVITENTAVEIIRSILDMSPTEAIIALYSAYKTELDESMGKGAPLEIALDDLIEANMSYDGVIESRNKRAIVNQLLIKAANKTHDLFAIIENAKPDIRADNQVHTLWTDLFGDDLHDPQISRVKVLLPDKGHSGFDANLGFDGRYFKLLVGIELVKILANIPLVLREGTVVYDGEEQSREEYPWCGDASKDVAWENYVNMSLMQVFACFDHKIDSYHKCDICSGQKIPRYFYTKMESTTVCLSVQNKQIYYWQLEEDEEDADKVRHVALAFGLNAIRIPTVDASDFEDQLKLCASMYLLLVNDEYNSESITGAFSVESHLDYAASIKFIDYNPIFSNCTSPIATTTTTKNSAIPESIPKG